MAGTSGGHWYFPDGRPCHEVANAKGTGYRNTTVADARKLGLLPSPTSITGVLDKAFLNNWAKEQVGKSAFDNRPAEGEEPDAYAKRLVRLAYQQVRESAEFGTKFHEVAEDVLNGGPVPEDWAVYIDPLLNWKKEAGLEFIEREKVVVNLKQGYAGTMDIGAKTKDGQPVVIDWKTRKTYPNIPDDKIQPYDGQIMQIASYAGAYWGEERVLAGEVFGANAYISSTEPGRFVVCKYTGKQLAEAYECFLHACGVWRYMKSYDPRKS